MNILPKKRWHVRTKENIARVRKDEAAAREEERKKLEKLEFAESEARINFLRSRSGLPEKRSDDSTAKHQNLHGEKQCSPGEHVNLFADYKSHVKTTNKDLEKEKKDEQEKYEKQIGYLTYLGQDTNEALRLKSWYEVAPKRLEAGEERDVIEKDLKNKHNHDPLTLINALLPPEPKVVQGSNTKRKRSPTPLSTSARTDTTDALKKLKKSKEDRKKHKKEKHKKEKHKKHHKERKERKKRSKSKEDDGEQKRLKLEQMRRERLKRESAEKARQDALLAPKDAKKPADTQAEGPRVVQKYNSQFNPELAKQNMN